MITKGYICDCCGREIRTEKYDSHRAVCFSEHYQPIRTKGVGNLNRFIDMGRLPKSLIQDSKLTIMEAA